MIKRSEQIKELFEEIGSAMKTKAVIYVIGGGVLLIRGLKPSTKDIDLVVDSKEDFEEVTNALRRIGFKAKKINRLYERFDLAYQLIREDFQIDLFCKKVCSKFQLSKNMKKRSEKLFSLAQLNVLLCSNEDIFLFKTMTERPGDIPDCVSLIQRGLEWNAVISELEHQVKSYGEDVWVTWIGERLDLLEKQGLNIPIMKEVDVLREKYFDDLEKRQRKKG
ncbi:hypothetical protein JW711_01360 [Candidatus Woesearchaeota archaeon]|nr:hypothetical protein [Candidatus Woesearchaeota archaeon]